jgi:methyl-accepting chemotaxis protein
LRIKIVASVAIMLLVISVFQMLFFPARMENISRLALEKRAKSMAIMLASAAVMALEFNDSATLEPILAGVAKADDVDYVGVQRGDGSVLAAINQMAIPRVVSAKGEPETVIENGRLRVDILVEPKVVKAGILTIGFKLDSMNAERRAQTWTVALVSALVLILGLALSFLVGTFLLRPIKELTRVTREIVRTGDLNQKVAVTSRDEVGVLAGTFQQMMEKLQVVPLTVRELSSAVNDLTQLISDHTESTQQQASGLTEATVTMQEIRQTTSTAASKAETVIVVAKKAEEFSAAGQAAVENSIKNLQDIRSGIEQIVAKTSDLSERTVEVSGIIETVKDLADQSNILALNASIEAVKAGESGRGFGVVAREIRSLADQSIQATARIRGVLTEIQKAIRSTASVTDQGRKDMERSMDQIRASGESLQEMNAVVLESSQAARQIAASVNQQAVGVSQATVAIEGLNSAMDKSTNGIRRAEAAAKRLTELSNQISAVLSG